LKAENCVVIEDSKNGLMAAKGAKMDVIITTNPYTEKEDLDQADIIITCLGDQDRDLGKLIKSKKPIDFNGVLNIQQIKKYFTNQ
jgi:beta-phosphoglucomutase-like phosphatase (HAD superfamily)